MATKALPLLCVLFLICSASLIFPSAEGIRMLGENKAGHDIVYNDPNRPAFGSPPGEPYTSPGCHSQYRNAGGGCSPPKAKP